MQHKKTSLTLKKAKNQRSMSHLEIPKSTAGGKRNAAKNMTVSAIGGLNRKRSNLSINSAKAANVDIFEKAGNENVDRDLQIARESGYKLQID